MKASSHGLGAMALVVLGLSCAGPRGTNATDQNASVPMNPVAERPTVAEISDPLPTPNSGAKKIGTCADRGKIGKLSFAHFKGSAGAYLRYGNVKRKIRSSSHHGSCASLARSKQLRS